MARSGAALALVEPTPSSGSIPPMARPPRPEGSWQPPTRVRALALTALVLVGAVAIARYLPAPDPSSTIIAGAREVTAYELVDGQPLSFALPPGAGELRVLTNLDLDSLDPAGVPYAVRVRIAEEGRDETYPLIARPALDGRGDRTAFFLRRPQSPARTRLLSLARASALPGTLEVSLLAGGKGRASLRVFVAQGRLGTPAPPRPLQAPTGRGLTVEDLAPDARAAFESQRWSRLPARQKAPTRSFFVTGTPEPLGPRESAGQPVGDGHVAAFTLKGPGTIQLEVVTGPLHGRAALLDGNGLERVLVLDLAAHGRLSVPLGRGLVTLRVFGDSPASVRLLAPPVLAVHPEQLRGADGRDEIELGPAWSWEALAVAGPDGPPVEVVASGRGEAAVRVTARLPLGAKAVAVPSSPLAWRFVDGRGAVLKNGVVSIAGAPAPEDRLDGPLGFASVPTTIFLWPPRGAARLLLTAPRPVAVSLASPALEAEQSAAEQLGLAKRLVLRHDLPARPAFHEVRALNAPALRRAARLLRFAGAMRLERLPDPQVPAEAASLVPDRNGGQFVMLAPVATPGPARGGGLSWAVQAGHDEQLSVPRPRGASLRARVPATLLYDLDRSRGREATTVSLDGKVIMRAAILGARGQIHLPPLPVGRHRLRIDLSGAGQLYVDQPVAGAPAFRRSRVFLLRGGGGAVRVPKGAAARSLGLVVYSDGPVRAAELEAIIDGGGRGRRAAGASTAYTRLRRRIPMTFTRLEGAHYLNRAGAVVWASAPVFVPLGDDLAPGTHLVSLRARGLGSQPIARFFSYGGPVTSRISQHVQVRAEVSQ
jgi:hypothetical protein